MSTKFRLLTLLIVAAFLPGYVQSENHDPEIETPLFQPFLSLMDTQLSIDCFAYPWPSGDNYEAVANSFGILDQQNFVSQPGKFVDQLLGSPDPIAPNWCESDSSKPECTEGVRLVQPIMNCLYDPETEPDEFSPKIRLWFVDTEKICSDLPPINSAQCAISLIVEISEYYEGGKPAWKSLFGAYSLILDRNSEMVLVPVLHMFNKDELLRFLQNLR